MPALGIVATRAGRYGLYLLWHGLPTVMRAPADRAAAYAGLVIAATVIATIVAASVVGSVAGGLPIRG